MRPDQKSDSRKPMQFSVLMLIGLLTISAIAALIYSLRAQAAIRAKRPLEFVAAIQAADFKTVDELLKIDPELVNHPGKQSPLQMSLVCGDDEHVCAEIFQRILDAVSYTDLTLPTIPLV